tara:strand:+ start:637 stop:1425 length:789 start_codon:yes stop_codon:yes gene_type:complete
LPVSSRLLDIQNLYKNFGGIHAVEDASFSIERGSITGLIGPNGAGKTTLFNVIAGVHSPDAGTVVFDGEDITAKRPHELFARGILRTFQIAHEFASLTVRENLMVVPGAQAGERLVDTWIHPRKVRVQEAELANRATEVIDFLQLTAVAEELAGNLSGGQKKLLELGRTMMAEPKLIFLDEVGAGVNRTLLGTIGDAILRLNQEKGYTFCMIEHDMDFISRLCDPVVVMAAGGVLTCGTPEEVMNNEAVIEAYLGTGRRHHR